MSDIKKRQHYVWRHYLTPWASDEKIWTYFKEQDKIVSIGLMGVAQEKNFYKLIDLTDAEETFLVKFIEQNSPDAVKNLNIYFLTLFTSHNKLKKKLEENTNPKQNKRKIGKEIERLEHNLMEDAHGKMEALGFDLLKCRSLEDLKSLEGDNKIFDAIVFLCFQYFRTKSMKKSVLQSFKGDRLEELINKTWNIISYSMATTLARNISVNENLKFIFMTNSTCDHFITGDQPVFNILNDKVNDKGEAIKLELYYPLSPYFAVKIHFDSNQVNKFTEDPVTEEIADYLNRKVVENSDFFVFADSKELLEKIK